MKKIPLSQGKFALVDDEDYEWLNKWKWYVSVCGYAVRNARINGKRITIKMHRVINKTPDNMYTDHKDGNRCNNQRKNIRTATRSQNSWNQAPQKLVASRFKGVSLDQKRWRARIRINRKLINLGSYSSEKDAAEAYNEAALKYHGEFARLNIIYP